jgi:hypothetical protein
MNPLVAALRAVIVNGRWVSGRYVTKKERRWLVALLSDIEAAVR